MRSSVRVGIEALVAANPRTAAVVLMLCDQPLVTREIIAGLVVAYLETGYPIVASRYCYGGSFGALPALFGSAYFGELATLEGAAGAKQVIQKHLQKVQLLPFPEGEIDGDSHGDFARLASTNYSDTSKSADLN